MMVPPAWLTAVTDSTLVPAGAFTEGAAQANVVEAEPSWGSAEAVGRYTAAASGTPAARTVRSRLIGFPSKKEVCAWPRRHICTSHEAGRRLIRTLSPVKPVTKEVGRTPVKRAGRPISPGPTLATRRISRQQSVDGPHPGTPTGPREGRVRS